MAWQQRFAMVWMLLGLLSSSAWGQSFPPPAAWAPLPCGTQIMTDGYSDESGARDERDIVGDLSAPAGYSASDEQFLFLRLRLDQDPAPNGKPRSAAWGFAISTDSDARTYEVLILLDGASNMVELYRNTTSTRSDDPQDPPDPNALASYPFATHARVEVTPDSSSGNNPDYFLSLAMPWNVLGPLGLTPESPVTVWAASSSNAHSFDGPSGDLACHAEADGAATFSAINAPRTVLDPALDTDGDGYPDYVELRTGTDPHSAPSVPAGADADGDGYPDSVEVAAGSDPHNAESVPAGARSSVELEGGGGCSVTQRAGGGACWLLVLALLVYWRRCAR